MHIRGDAEYAQGGRVPRFKEAAGASGEYRIRPRGASQRPFAFKVGASANLRTMTFGCWLA